MTEIESVRKELTALRKALQKDNAELRENIRLDAIYYPLLLTEVFKDPAPLSAMTSWSVAPEFAWWLFQHICEKKPRLVIELGSGTSTVVIAEALQRNGGGKLISFEHDFNYLEKTKALLGSSGAREHVELVYAPLREYTIDEALFRWYDIPWDLMEHASSINGIDLVVVDGPPGATNPMARYPAHPLLRRYYAENAIIVLDDTHRSDEKDVISKWHSDDKCIVSIETLSSCRHAPTLLHWSHNELAKSDTPSESEHDSLTHAVSAALSKLADASSPQASALFIDTIYELLGIIYSNREARLNTIKQQLSQAQSDKLTAQINFQTQTAQLTRELHEKSEALQRSRDNEQGLQGKVQELQSTNDKLTRELHEKSEALQRSRDNEQGLQGKVQELQSTNDKLARDLRNASDEIAHIKEIQRDLQRTLSSIRNSRAMTVAKTVKNHIRTPRGWLTLPWAVFSTYSQHRAADRPQNTQTQACASSAHGGTPNAKLTNRPPPSYESSENSKRKQTQSSRSKSTLWQAQQHVPSGGWAAALNYANTRANPTERHGIELLKANLSQDDERWLSHLNQYLSHYNTSPVHLLPGDEPRFYRLTGTSKNVARNGPLISVIMPAFNAEKTIRHAARSILQQSWQELELLIVDDASTDQTWDVLNSLRLEDARVRIFRNGENVGPYVSKNIALQHALGAFITGHDADDWAHPHRLEKHYDAIMASEAPLVASVTYMLRVTETGIFSHFTKIGHISPDGAARRAFISCMFEANFLKNRLGYWDSVRFGADSEIMARTEIATGAPLPNLNQISMLCLDHDTSLTNHPEFGIDKITGASTPRRLYKQGYEDWHKTLSESATYLSFPPTPRPFAVPREALISEEQIRTSTAD